MADASWRRALAIRERLLDGDDPALARSLSNLGTICQARGRYREAEGYMLRGLAVLHRAASPQELQIARCLANLGNLYVYQNRFAEADSLLARALATSEAILGPDHPDNAAALNSLAGVYHKQGRFTEADRLYQRALSVWEAALGPRHPYVAYALQNLGLVAKEQGRFSQAEDRLRQALEILEGVYGPDHAAVGPLLHNLANLYLDQGDASRARPLVRRAREIFERGVGFRHPHFALALLNEARLLDLEGSYAPAESVCLQALDVQLASLGEDHPETADSLELLSALQRRRRDRAAVSTARRAFTSRQRNVAANAVILSEPDALAYAQSTRRAGSRHLACFFDLAAGDRSAELEAIDTVLLSKGQVTDVVFARNRRLIEESDALSVALLDSLKEAKFALARHFVAGDDAGAGEMDSLTAAVDRFESSLSRRSARFRELRHGGPGVAQLAALLPKGTALVEFLRYERGLDVDDPDGSGYAAAVICQGAPPHLIDLGGAAPIDSLVKEYRKHMFALASGGVGGSEDDTRAYRDIAGGLYDRLWRPLGDAVRNNETVLIAPDGALNMVSFAGLWGSDDGYLIERTVVHYVSASRDLLWFQEPFRPGRGLLALGDPDYDAPARLVQSQAGTGPKSGSHEAAHRSARSSCPRLNDVLLDPLPATRQEVERVAQGWNERRDGPAIIYLGADASEARFKVEAGGKRVLYLATHGYFLGSGCADGDGVADQRIDPLLSSGLFLAGANRSADAANGGWDDGVLTAYEVSAMQLAGTELVVLSACDSNSGKVRIGEGVYGVRRAFQQAGARTVISTLWPISDRASAETLSGLYANDSSVTLALREIQLARIHALRAAGRSDHPIGWDGYVVAGQWR